MQAFFHIDPFTGDPYTGDMSEQVSHLRQLRESVGLSVRELARRIDQQPTNISFWERTGKLPRSDVLVPIAKALGVSVEELLGEKEPRRTTPDSRLGRSFEAVSKLPRRQQGKILDVVEALIAQQSVEGS